MTRVNYVVTDDFKARQIYEKAIFYSRAGYTDVKVTESSADNINHRWRKDVIEFTDSKTKLKTKVALKLNVYPDALNNKGLPKHTLEIEFLEGEIEPAKNQLEDITGINF